MKPVALCWLYTSSRSNVTTSSRYSVNGPLPSDDYDRAVVQFHAHGAGDDLLGRVDHGLEHLAAQPTKCQDERCSAHGEHGAMTVPSDAAQIGAGHERSTRQLIVIRSEEHRVLLLVVRGHLSRNRQMPPSTAHPSSTAFVSSAARTQSLRVSLERALFIIFAMRLSVRVRARCEGIPSTQCSSSRFLNRRGSVSSGTPTPSLERPPAR